MVSTRHVFLLCLAILTFAPAAYAQRTISAVDYRDRLAGMWVGELLGNYAGRQNEGNETITAEGPNWIASKSITQYNVPWTYIVQGTWFQWNTNQHISPNYWQADDDTAVEFAYAYALQSQATLNATERTAFWTNQITGDDPGRLYFANKRAWTQMNDYGRSAAEAGSVRYNIDAGWTIDAQITTEVLGSLAVGMRQQAADLAGDLGGITNSGYSVHAAQFYAAMYADAPFTSDVETIVDRGLEVVPTGSWTREIIEKAIDLHTNDTAGTDWLASRNAIIAFAGQRGRDDRFWVESASNTGLTTLAILYGQGNFMDTVELGVRGGEDSDCNPATAGGLVGMMKGEAAILAELTAAGLSPALPANYSDSGAVDLGQDNWTTTEVLDIFQAAVETQILAGGGTIDGGIYSLPDIDTGLDSVVTGDVSDPIGPTGLVGDVLTLGGQVDVIVRRNGSVMSDNSAYDRTDQGRLIDGVTDVTNNGVLPFRTYDGGSGAQTDMYELHFFDSSSDEFDITFEKLVLHEGDAKYNSNNYGEDNFTLIGGFFQQGELLTVEVEQDGSWVGVANLALSEALVDREYFQTIELTFDEIEGQAIRVFGSAGGSRPFTSLTELEAFGVFPEITPGNFDHDQDIDDVDIDLLADAIRLGSTDFSLFDISADGTSSGTDGAIDINDLDYLVRFLVETSAVDGGGNPIFGTEYGDFNLDGEIELGDLTRLGTYYGVGDTWAEGNANRNLDLDIELGDLTILGTYYGASNGGVDTIPEPATMSLLALGGLAALRRRRR